MSKLTSISSEPPYDAEFQHFLRGKEVVLTGTALPKVKGLTSDQCEAMVRLNRLSAFKDLVAKVEADDVGATTYCSLTSKGVLSELLLILFLFAIRCSAILHVD